MTAAFKLIYVGDPLCSWCYGFAPQIARLRARFPGLPSEILLGGLRPYTRAPMDRQFAETLRHHWQQVAARTQQPFNYDLLERCDFVYDTEPPSRAIAVMRKLDPERCFDFFDAVQRAFYVENADTNEPAVYAGIARRCGIEPATFETEFESDALRRETREDFERARSLGIQGFPSLLLERDGRLYVLCQGYSEAGELIPLIEGFAAGAGGH